ncbi:MAG: thiaminase II, partial [Chitinophagaceae bacterium]
GSLPPEKFRFYMIQDSLYLEHFGRALAVVAARAPDVKDVLSFIRFAEGAIVVENALHEKYFGLYGVSDRGHPEPACHHYVHYLKSTAAFDPVEVGMAALLPCFWIYKKVGDYILRENSIRKENAAREKDINPYQLWIDTYGGEEFAVAVNKAISICDIAAAQATPAMRERMTGAFVTSSKLEFDFWQGAYDLRK